MLQYLFGGYYEWNEIVDIKNKKTEKHILPLRYSSDYDRRQQIKAANKLVF
ncbi:hypothetical protein DOY81_006222 [Sarcophaga bullata]|nr:hypothetical protein DOY81_006222 [Sarcophaga bullata]